MVLLDTSNGGGTFAKSGHVGAGQGSSTAFLHGVVLQHRKHYIQKIDYSFDLRLAPQAAGIALAGEETVSSTLHLRAARCNDP